jgi:CheY-like chemotaxis protein
MPDGGHLTIETSNLSLDERAAIERDVAAGDYVAIRVTDTGSGMPPDVAARAFDPFFTTKPIGMGTGLGLSMIYGFVKQSEGQVNIHTMPGHGTTVKIILPRAHSDVPAESEPPVLAAAPRARAGQTVLVVDDEHTVRMLVAEILEELGYATLEAEDGAAGLNLLKTAERVDLLITDVGLPGGMNGRQLAEMCRGTHPALKVLFITGYAEKAMLRQGSLAPGMHILNKPFALETLATRIRMILGEE